MSTFLWQETKEQDETLDEKTCLKINTGTNQRKLSQKDSCQNCLSQNGLSQNGYGEREKERKREREKERKRKRKKEEERRRTEHKSECLMTWSANKGRHAPSNYGFSLACQKFSSRTTMRSRW